MALPRGPEVRVNTTVAGCQGFPAVAAAPDGSFVVVWQSQGQDGDGWGIFAQRFDRSGTPVGGEVAVNEGTAGDQQAPAVIYDPSGTFYDSRQSAPLASEALRSVQATGSLWDARHGAGSLGQPDRSLAHR